jgi:GNAT superfamily N-acetyltransferase
MMGQVMAMGITIRQPRQGEYGGVVGCLRETRGPRYYGGEYYDESYLAGGDVEIFAAFDESGGVAGFAGLSAGLFNAERTTGCLLTVRPEFRGQGIAKALIGHFTGRLRERGALVVKGQAVSSHIVAQKMIEAQGWVPTGFLYGARDNKNQHPSGTGKSALVLYTGKLGAIGRKTVYVCERLGGRASAVYGQLGIEADIVLKGRPGRTALNRFCDEHNRCLYVQAERCGDDLPERLAGLRAEHGAADCVTVALNLADPSAAPGAALLLEAGYEFCGFDPAGQFEHAIFFAGAGAGSLNLTEKAEKLRYGVEAI